MMEQLNYVNIHGQQITDEQIALMRAAGENHAMQKRRMLKGVPSDKPAGYHKGWRVVGISPEQIQVAREGRERVRKMALDAGSAHVPPRFNVKTFLSTAKGKPARAKPFEIFSAAQQCKELAERAGWLNVQILEVKKG